MRKTDKVREREKERKKERKKNNYDKGGQQVNQYLRVNESKHKKKSNTDSAD